VVYSSHVQFFHEYMTILGLDTSLFGLPVARGGWTPEEEETILAGFAVHVWRHPRRVRSSFVTTLSLSGTCSTSAATSAAAFSGPSFSPRGRG
jgi:hypothetical protein